MPNYYYIWFKVYEEGKLISSGRYHQAYVYKHNAERRAKQMWSKDLFNPLTGTTISRKWVISETNPWPDPVYDI